MRTRHGARFLGVFALTILVPGGLLAALGVRALIQERQAAGAELERRLDRSTDLVAREVERELVSWQAAAARAGSDTPFNATLLPDTLRKAASEPGSLALAAFGSGGPRVWPERQMLYAATSAVVAASAPGGPPAALAEADAAELRDKDYTTAARLYKAFPKGVVAGRSGCSRRA